MVSDASSGPPHFQEDEVVFNVDHNSCFYPDSKDVRLSKTSGKKKKNSREQFGRCGGQVQESSFLDDTASSPVYNFSMNDFARSNNQASMQSVLEFSQGGLKRRDGNEIGGLASSYCIAESSCYSSLVENGDWFLPK
ncbi:hypothetical protein FEM48_Zijuj09G0138900 [Ziziphus jujuba var. spinosa]|uniref:Uncharacterized protein n=1 Tax=Ziziphus jujuba var. spinosa TaxID=714518 RepID=A0A978UTC7_ZIZJJ|nr:hypothetical protein FEM48_Zijuj09G0138900 [Ziziphus jujuba var. spinosa]